MGSATSPPAPTTRTSTATLSAHPQIARARRAPPDLPAPLDRPARRGRRDRPAPPTRPARRVRRPRPAPPAPLFFNEPATTQIHPLSLHDALPISPPGQQEQPAPRATRDRPGRRGPRAGT